MVQGSFVQFNLRIKMLKKIKILKYQAVFQLIYVPSQNNDQKPKYKHGLYYQVSIACKIVL